jgi:hypothetical protein
MSPMPCVGAFNRERRCSIASPIIRNNSNLFSPPVGANGPVVEDSHSFFNFLKRDKAKLDKFEMELLELKAYTPYFISKLTVIEYHPQERGAAPNKLSIMDILTKHFEH